MKKFYYCEPASLEEALFILNKQNDEFIVMAGGTDLIPKWKMGLNFPKNVIGLNLIKELSKLSNQTDLQIGSTATLYEIQKFLSQKKNHKMIFESISVIGSPLIRNLATLGGNLCNASPSADSAPALLAADAKISIKNIKESRVVPLSEFFISPGKTILSEDELLVNIIIPDEKPFSGNIYKRHSLRKALDLAVVGVAVSITLEPENEKIIDARIALGAVAPTPIRVTAAEKIIKDNRISSELIAEAAELAVVSSKPISDVRSSASYRKKIIKYLTRYCLEQAFLCAKKNIEENYR